MSSSKNLQGCTVTEKVEEHCCIRLLQSADITVHIRYAFYRHSIQNSFYRA